MAGTAPPKQSDQRGFVQKRLALLLVAAVLFLFLRHRLAGWIEAAGGISLTPVFSDMLAVAPLLLPLPLMYLRSSPFCSEDFRRLVRSWAFRPDWTFAILLCVAALLAVAMNRLIASGVLFARSEAASDVAIPVSGLVLIAVVLPVVEELFFRGALQTTLRKILRPFLSILLIVLCFMRFILIDLE